MRSLLRVVLVAGVWSCASLAAAQPAGNPDEAAARELFEAGRAAYEAGDYEQALTKFRAAYEQSRRPPLLYNIGQAADRLRRNEEALEAFRAYLAEVPEAENRTSVENRVRLLERIVEEEGRRPGTAAQDTAPQPATPPNASPPEAQPRAQPDAPHPAPAEAVEQPSPLPIGPLVVAGAGVVVVAVGALVGAMAKSSEDDYAALPVTTREEIDAADETLSDGRTQATVANVLLGVGAATVVAGGVWFALEWDDGESSATVAPVLGPGLAGLGVVGHVGGGRW